jgi:hypothetical protein
MQPTLALFAIIGLGTGAGLFRQATQFRGMRARSRRSAPASAVQALFANIPKMNPAVVETRAGPGSFVGLSAKRASGQTYFIVGPHHNSQLADRWYCCLHVTTAAKQW